MTRLHRPVMLAVAVGFAVTLYAIGRVGFGAMIAVAARIGPGGFALICLYTIATLIVLGGAWAAAMPGVGAARLPLFAWARATREASADLLPFSQLGGLVVGARTLTAAGLAPAPVYAALIVDLTTEMAGQLVLTLYGLAAFVLLVLGDGGSIGAAALAGAAICVAMLGGFVLLQRPLLAFANRLSARWLPGARLPFDAVRAELDRLYRAAWPVGLSFLCNLVAWLMTGLLAWAAFRMMGTAISPARAIALESLILAVRSAAFLIPGALGVQEGAYLLLAQAFGVDPHAAIAFSLLKRARDVAIGLPTLLIWQAREWRVGLKAAP